MKKISFKIASLLLAYTVLFSTLSFGVNKHYCGDKLFSKSYFFHSQDCNMESMDLSDSDNPFSELMKNNNCHNIRLHFNGQNIEQKALISSSLEIHKLALIIAFNSFDFESDYLQQPLSYQNYSPPLLVKNISILVQTFRI